MKKFFSFVFSAMVLFGANAMAQELTSGEFMVNGIKYNGDAETQTASIIGIEEGFAQTEVNIPETVNGFTVTSIAYRAFANAKTMLSFTMPNTVVAIEGYAFRGCTNLQVINLSEQLNSIGEYAFHKDESLSSILIPNSVTTIGTCAFGQCINLKTVELSQSLERLEDALFSNCTNLESVELPNSIKSIGNDAFFATNLKNIYIPASVISLEYSGELMPSFMGIANLESIIVDEENPVYDSRQDCNAIIITATNELMVGCKNSTIPSTVEKIGTYAFYNITGLQRVDLPNSLKEIGTMAFSASGIETINISESVLTVDAGAFANCEDLHSASLSLVTIPNSLFVNCKKLTNITIGNNATTIGELAFRRCGFCQITLPNTLNEIGRQAFQGCVNLETITIPSGVTSISERAFQNCDVLHSVISRVETPFAVESNVFSRVIDGMETPTTATLYVPKGRKELYKSTEGWNQFATILEEGEILTTPVTGISLDKETITITEGETETLTATITPSNATDKTVTWTTNNSAVATVDNGVVTAVKAGTATITATAGGCSASCVVTVEVAVHSITSLAELSNSGVYYICQANHSKGATSWAVATNGNALKSNKDFNIATDMNDTRQQFAILSIDGGVTRYLYHVATQMFVNKDGSLSTTPADAISFMNGAYDNTFFAYFDGSHYVNVGGSQQMIIDGWNTPDGGNSCSIIPVGEFDSTNALKAINDLATGIDEVNDEVKGENGEVKTIYDLQGRKVTHPTKGIYIINGKKVLVK